MSWELIASKYPKAAAALGPPASFKGGRPYWHCPAAAHVGGNAACSLSAWERDGRLLVGCWACCGDSPTRAQKLELLHALGLEFKDLFADAGHRDSGPKPRPVAYYPYRDAAGRLAYQTVRLEPGYRGRKKEFRQRRPLPGGGWAWGIAAGRYRRSGRDLYPDRDGAIELPDVERVLYRLPELRTADRQRFVWVVGGEKNADHGARIGLVTTTNVCGERAEWLPGYSADLAGRHVVLVPDNDAPGRDHVRDVAGHLVCAGVASIRVLPLPGVGPKGDLSDWIGQRPGCRPELLRAELVTLARSRPSHHCVTVGG